MRADLRKAFEACDLTRLRGWQKKEDTLISELIRRVSKIAHSDAIKSVRDQVGTGT